MEPLNLNQLQLVPTPLGGKSRMLADRPELRLVNLVLEPGEEVKSHSAPVEVVFLVLSGQGSLQAGEEIIALHAGQITSCPPDLSRSICADPKQGLSLLVIRAPNQ